VFVDAQIVGIGVDHVPRWWYVLRVGSLLAAAFITGQIVDIPERTMGLDESDLLAGSLYLIAQAGRSGPMAAWRMLRRLGKRK
jgi:hypothetical protein